MKKISILAAIALTSAAASAQTMTLKGTMPDEYNGKKVVLVDLDTRAHIDSTTVKAGNITFNTKVASGEAMPAALMINNRRVLNFVLEPGEAIIYENGQVKGTPLNNLNESVGEALDSLSRDYKAKQGEIMKSSMSNDEKMKAAEARLSKSTLAKALM